MAKVSLAGFTDDFGSFHPHRKVLLKVNVFCINRIVKAWPAGMAVEFGTGGKKRRVADGAFVHAAIVIIGVFAGKRRFRSFEKANVILFGREFFLGFVLILTVHASILTFFRETEALAS